MAAALGTPQTADLYMPSVMEITEYFQQQLKKHFQEATVRATTCPDLRKEPFNLISPGLSGDSFILQVGGVKNVIPCPNRDKIYELQAVATACDLRTVTLYGAAGGPLKKMGINSEAAVNVRTAVSPDKAVDCRNYLAQWGDDGSMQCKQCTEPQLSYIGDCFGSQGVTGRVLRFDLKRRTSEQAANILGLLRSILIERFGAECSVGMGGVVYLKRGKARVHIMKRSWGDGPLQMSDIFQQVEVPAPLIGLGMFVTNECGINLNQNHMHTYSSEGRGGHFEEEVSADEVEYELYLSFAQRAVHLDPAV